MPLYEYQCEECAARFEERRSMADADRAAVCPTCDSLLTIRVISAAAWIGSSRTEPRDIPATQQKTHRAGCACCASARKR
jgi:putative FmdB family regulatory protein